MGARTAKALHRLRPVFGFAAFGLWAVRLADPLVEELEAPGPLLVVANHPSLLDAVVLF